MNHAVPFYGKLKAIIQGPVVRRIYKFMWLPFIIGVVVMALWYFRYSKANFYFEVTTDYAVFDPAGQWTIVAGDVAVDPAAGPTASSSSLLPLKSLYVENIDKEAFEEKNPFCPNPKNIIEVSDVDLQILSIASDEQQEDKTGTQDENATVELYATASFMTLSVKNASISGEYNLKESATAGMPPETIRFKTQIKRDNIPTRITLSTFPDQAWIIDTLKIKRIHFEKETPTGSGKFVSRVVSGKLTVINSKKEVDLGWADDLYIDQVAENRRMLIRHHPGGFSIAFMGQASVLKAGPRGFEEDLRPRILEAWYNSTPIILFIWAFTIIGGVLGVLHREAD